MPSVSRIYLSGIWEVLVMIITLLTSADRRKPILPYPGKCAVAKRIVHDKVQTDREVLESEIQKKLRVEFEARTQELQRELVYYMYTFPFLPTVFTF